MPEIVNVKVGEIHSEKTYTFFFSDGAVCDLTIYRNNLASFRLLWPRTREYLDKRDDYMRKAMEWLKENSGW